MFIDDCVVASNTKIAENTFLIGLEVPFSTEKLLPGQFFNIKVSNNSFPLLRRPFSISDVIENRIYFMYKVVGEGTSIISKKVKGETLNLLGPLGNSFNIDDSFSTAIIIGGGIGIAPFPFLIKKLVNKNIQVLFGMRSKSEAHNYGLVNINYSSDDGSIGLHGNVIDLLDVELKNSDETKTKIFACGPNAMFRALQKYLTNKNVLCEASMESAMACGFGICQGCPIEFKNNPSYNLICKDGPVFNIKDIVI
ncbi:MAG: dihydroorotate dehydrogenase electron transfer subunit [Ignavibacteriales bacterium]|nr:dihydroorotate dehydrogenase electron transfer subunit [Ignavibacteriales bacterium]